MRLVADIEATGLLDHTTLDYSEYPFKLKDTFKIHCLVAKDIDSGKVFKLYQDSLTEEKVKQLFSEASEVIFHNGIGYDLPVLMLYFGIDYKLKSKPEETDYLDGRPCRITDTAVISRTLWPDRPQGHSLKEWGKKLGILKGVYGQEQDAWEEFSEDMLEYCQQDVEVTLAVYNALSEEQGKWDWSKAICMEQAIAEVVFRQEHFGFGFNKQKAQEALDDLNEKMDTIEKRVEPLLPEKKISKTAAKKFVPPKLQFKKNGEPSANTEKFVERLGGVLGKKGDTWCMQYKGKTLELPLPQEPLEDTEPMTLANQSDLKQHLVDLGWNPTVWSENDLTVNSKKQKIPYEKYKESVYRYCMETKDSSFRKFRLEQQKCRNVKELYQKLMTTDRDRPMRVLSSPKYTVNQEKDICPNLEKLGERVGFVSDVVLWLTYRHRRNSILSPKGTGFLSQPRIEIDGRIQTPAITCGAATSRMQHKTVANIPRPTSVYGAPMREMFCVPERFYQLGCDAAGLEARVEAHYTMPYEGGQEYAEALLGEKPNDIHSVTAKKMGIARDVAKTLKYAISYGAQPPKVAKSMDWPLGKAKKVFEDFWDAALPLQQLKEKVEKFWEKKGGRKFIVGIDGRKLMARSKHSLVNLLFQSCGVIVMKQAAVMLDRWLEQENLLFNPFKDASMQGKAAEMIHYHDEYQLQVCESLVNARVFETEEEAKEFSVKGKRIADVSHVDGGYLVGYSHVGELMSEAIVKAAEHYKMRIPFDGDYQMGFSWKDCH